MTQIESSGSGYIETLAGMSYKGFFFYATQIWSLFIAIY